VVELLALREKVLRAAERVEMTAATGLEAPRAPLAGATIVGTGFAEHLQITGSNVTVLARFPGDGDSPGDPAITMARYGKWRAILAGSFVAAAFEQDPDGARASGDLIGALVALAGAVPDVRISGAPGQVESRYLESSTATMLVAINHSDLPQKVTFAFTPDTPEAIWLNMETGSSVNFVAAPDGPTYTYAFKPRDVLVLMIKKDLR
jgi:hypothetical protein